MKRLTVPGVVLGVLLGLALLILHRIRALEARAELELEAPTSGVVHGIETDWQSARGLHHRLWSATGRSSDFRPWLEEHVQAFDAAQSILPTTTPPEER